MVGYTADIIKLLRVHSERFLEAKLKISFIRIFTKRQYHIHNKHAAGAMLFMKSHYPVETTRQSVAVQRDGASRLVKKYPL